MTDRAPIVTSPMDFQHWFIARSRSELKRGEVICLLGLRLTYTYVVLSRSRVSDSILVGYRKEGWKRDRVTVLNNVRELMERGVILVHDGASRVGA